MTAVVVETVLLAAACAVGAVGRYLLDRLVQSLHTGAFPWGTWVVNVLGSLALGLAAGVAHREGVPTDVVLLVGTGLLGSFTTFSTMTYETVRLLEEHRAGLAVANLAASTGAGVLAAAAGVWLAATVWGIGA